MLLQKWDVFLVELLLQGLCCRGDDHATPAADRRQQIGQGLPRPGSRFDDDVMARFKRVLHQLRHLELRAAVLVATDHASFQESARPEDFLHAWRRRFLLGRRARYSGIVGPSLWTVIVKRDKAPFVWVPLSLDCRTIPVDRGCFAFRQIVPVSLSHGTVFVPPKIAHRMT